MGLLLTPRCTSDRFSASCVSPDLKCEGQARELILQEQLWDKLSSPPFFIPIYTYIFLEENFTSFYTEYLENFAYIIY